MMDNKDLDVEKALDELFDGDFIDKDDKIVTQNTNVYVSNDENNIVFMDFETNNANNVESNLTNKNGEIKENDTIKNEVVFDLENLDKLLEDINLKDEITFNSNDSLIENNSQINEVIYSPASVDNSIENEELEKTIIPDILPIIEENNSIENTYVKEKKDNIDKQDELEKTIIPTVLPVVEQSEETKENEDNIINNLEENNEVIFPYEKVKKEEYIEKKQNKPEILKIILIAIIVLISIFSVVGFIIKVTTPGTIKCTYKADTDEFTLSDEYEIDFKSGEILSVIGEYKYRSKTEDFNKEIQFIKDEKIPVIVNSNGMPGFTYIYEVEDEIIKVYTYLDFTMFDYDEISKVNQKTTPISYFNIEKNMKVKDLKKIFKDKGYICK